MDLNDIKELFSLLKDNGDKVLDGSNKLTLSIDLLQYLVESFNLIVEQREDLNTTFEVINTFNSKVEIFRDLQFLHDFVQKTIALKVCPKNKNDRFVGHADISKFRNLKLLELWKVSVQEILGIKNLRSQLHCLICTRCLNDLDDILVSCGGDKANGFMWSELKEGVFSHNNIQSIDKTALEYIPWLQMLDLSHNKIKDAQALSCLPNLKHLNLSYNKLEQMPIFSSEQSRMIQVLVLKHNYIEDLISLVALSSLCELDVSYNSLIEHSALSALPMLATLQWLCLEGNPLSYHPHHRILTARYLHSNTASVKFVLDHQLLSKRELHQIGTYHTNCIRLPEHFGGKHDPLTSIPSSITSSTVSCGDTAAASISESYSKSHSSRRGRVRQAVISEHDDDGTVVDPEMNKSFSSVHSLEASLDHLETKRQIEDLREKYGETWLHSQGGSLFQDVLGIEKTPIPVFSSTPHREDSTFYKSVISDKLASSSPQSSKTLVFDSDSANNSIVPSTDMTETNYKSMIDSATSDDNLYSKSGDSPSITSYDADDHEDLDEQLFIVQLEQSNENMQQLFLCISLKSGAVRERNAATAKTQVRWPLSTLLSCERTSKGVQITFDTVRRDRQSRDYVVEDDEAQNLVQVLTQVLSTRTLSERNQKVYKCMKCSTIFSLEMDEHVMKDENVLKCPACPSTLVIEQEDELINKPIEPLVSTREVSPPETAECALPGSPSHSSIVCDARICCSEAAPVLLRVMADVHASAGLSSAPLCSATSLEESTSSQISIGDNQQKKGDSDIEVLSDPSQDSIEVLSVLARGPSLTPRRKRSSEERKLFIPHVLPTTITETAPKVTTVTVTTTGMTESSSSDSLTDSVRTAYDNHSKPPIHLNNMKKITLTENTEINISPMKNIAEEKIASGSASTLSSMLEGFLQSASKIISTPPSNTPVSKKSPGELNVEFSYTDFMQVDHRVKLHLYLNIFEDEQEELVWLLRTQILPHSSEQPYGGCLVLSTRKVYLLKIDENCISDETVQWLCKSESYTVDRLQTVFALPWKQGVGLEIRQTGIMSSKPMYILCFLQDLLRTSSFLAYLASQSSSLPDSCELQCTVSEQTLLKMQQLLLASASQSDSDPTTRIMCVYSTCQVSFDEKQEMFSMGCLLISNYDLVLTSGDLTWMRPDADSTPKISRIQPMSNLIEINCKDKTITLDYLDESAGTEEAWKVTLDTSVGIEGIVEAIRKPWESLFSVSLQVNFHDKV